MLWRRNVFSQILCARITHILCARKMSSMTGLLVLTQPLKKILPRIPQVLSLAKEHVSSTLYIHLDPLAVLPYSAPQVSLYDRFITKIYEDTTNYACQGLDVRVLMTGFKHQSEVPFKTHSPIELVLFDISHTGNELTKLEGRYKSFLHANNHIFLQSSQENISADTQRNNIAPEINENIEKNINELQDNNIYDDVALGGTFDRIHAGHKTLLSQALLRCRSRLTIGVADGVLLKNKTLKELILPIEQRIADVKTLLIDVDPSCEYNIVPINDPIGPTGWDTKMEMLVVSEETYKGVDFVNAERKRNGLAPLKGHTVKLVDDENHSDEEEEKVSSSSARMRLLGTLLRPPIVKDSLPNNPYIIGLTGGTGSGKSTIAKRLEGLGAGVIDCDKLGHEAYMQGTNCYSKLIATFGDGIVAEDGSINRRALAPIVFASKDKLDLLNSIVWPEIARLTQDKIKILVSEGKEIIILDAAVLLDAQWDNFCHQIWVSTIKRDEAIRRIVDRDGKSVEEAERRIDNQMSNEERIAQANIVFCTQWAHDYTQSQVEKAWETLKNFTKESKSQL